MLQCPHHPCCPVLFVLLQLLRPCPSAPPLALPAGTAVPKLQQGPGQGAGITPASSDKSLSGGERTAPGAGALSTAQLPGPAGRTDKIQLQCSAFIQCLTHKQCPDSPKGRLFCPHVLQIMPNKLNLVSRRLLYKE